MKTLRVYKEYDEKSGKRYFEIELFVTPEGYFWTCEKVKKNAPFYLAHNSFVTALNYFQNKVNELTLSIIENYVKQ